MAHHNQLGQWGENIAVEHLVANGYAIVERNWRMHHYEIDVVAMKDNLLVVVEIKTRSSEITDPTAVITKGKIQRMVSSANAFAISRKIPLGIRFDVIFIVGNPDSYRIEHIVDAFLPPLKTYR